MNPSASPPPMISVSSYEKFNELSGKGKDKEEGKNRKKYIETIFEMVFSLPLYRYSSNSID